MNILSKRTDFLGPENFIYWEKNEGNSINYLWFSLKFIISFKGSHFYYSLRAKIPSCATGVGFKSLKMSVSYLKLPLVEKCILATPMSVIMKSYRSCSYLHIFTTGVQFLCLSPLILYESLNCSFALNDCENSPNYCNWFPSKFIM